MIEVSWLAAALVLLGVFLLGFSIGGEFGRKSSKPLKSDFSKKVCQ